MISRLTIPQRSAIIGFIFGCVLAYAFTRVFFGQDWFQYLGLPVSLIAFLILSAPGIPQALEAPIVFLSGGLFYALAGYAIGIVIRERHSRTLWIALGCLIIFIAALNWWRSGML